MSFKPTITEAERHELRKRAGRWMAKQPRRMIEVPADHLLDLLDCADWEVDALERVKELEDVLRAADALIAALDECQGGQE